MSDDANVMAPRDRSFLWRGLLVTYCLFVAAVTWAPFWPRWPSWANVVYYSTFLDIFVNLVLFAPAGFLYAACLGPKWGRRPPWARSLAALGFGVLFSALIESGQLFIKDRFTSPFDLATNGIGAWFGAEVYRRVMTVLEGRLGERLALELPLAQQLYLLSVAAFMSSLASIWEADRAVVDIVLGVAGGACLAGLWRDWLHLLVRPWLIVASAALWYGTVNLPAFSTNRWTLPIGASLSAVTTWALLRHGPAPSPEEAGRVALWTQRVTAWVLLIFLLALVIWPMQAQLGSLQLELEVDRLDLHLGLIESFRLMEVGFAFLAGGFALASSWDRPGISSSVFRTGPLLIAAVLVVVFEVLRCLHPAQGANILSGAVELMGAMTGIALSVSVVPGVKEWRPSTRRSDNGRLSERSPKGTVVS